MVVAITEKSRVGNHKGGVATTPKTEMIAPAHAGHPPKRRSAFHVKIGARLEGGQGAVEQGARTQVGNEGNKMSPARATATDKRRIPLASRLIVITSQHFQRKHGAYVLIALPCRPG